MKNILRAITLCALSGSAALAHVQVLKNTPPNSTSLSIGLVPITAVISDFKDTVRAIKKYAEDPLIDVIVLQINSTGGAAGTSQVIAEFVRWAGKVKPIIAFISDYGTARAYWIASACSWIIAPEAASIGHIGTVIEVPKEADYIAFTDKNSKFKRPVYLAEGVLDPAHAANFQERVDAQAAFFYDTVAQWRGIDAATIKSLEARIYTGIQALELGLVDQLGTLQAVFDSALNLTKTRSGDQITTIKLIEPQQDVLEFAV